MKITLLSLCFLCLLNCNSQQKKSKLPENMYQLNGTVTGLENGEFYLISKSKRDTVFVKKNKFSIKDSISEPSSRMILFPNTDLKAITVFLEPKIMEMNIDINNITEYTLKGSESNIENKALEVQLNLITDKYQKFLVRVQNFDAIKIEEKSRVLDSLGLYNQEKNEVIHKFIKEKPNSYVGLDKLSNMAQYGYKSSIKKSFSLLSPQLKNTARGVEIKNSFEEVSLSGEVGNLAANFTAVDLNDNIFSLADYKGKYVLLDFWANWCVPCRKGFPHLKKTYRKYKSKGFEVIAISTDVNAVKAWKNAINKDKTELWVNILSNGTNKELETQKEAEKNETLIEIDKMYQVSALPTKILINPEGEIILRLIGSGAETDKNLDKKLDEVFK